MDYMLFLDLIVLCILGTTIAFCYRLHKQIASLQSNKREMFALIESFDATISNAEKSISLLKESTQNAIDERNRYLDAGEALAKELSIMIDAGRRLAQRLERSTVETELEVQPPKKTRQRKARTKTE